MLVKSYPDVLTQPHDSPDSDLTQVPGERNRMRCDKNCFNNSVQRKFWDNIQMFLDPDWTNTCW